MAKAEVKVNPKSIGNTSKQITFKLIDVKIIKTDAVLKRIYSIRN